MTAPALRSEIRPRVIPEPEAAAAADTTITALPDTVNLALYQGDDFFVDLTVTDGDGNPADLTGAVATAEIRATAAAPELMAAFVGTVVDNVVHLHLPSAEAVKLRGPAVWDCQIAMPEVTTLVAGTVAVTPHVTPP